MMTLTIVANCPSARQIFGCCAILLRLKSTFISNEESGRLPRPRKWWPVRWDLAKEGLAKAVSAVRPSGGRDDSGDLRYVEQIVIAALGLLEAEMTRLKI